MNLAQFNKTYKNSLKEIKLQEKVNPRKAKNMWLNLIKLMVSFGKSDECPANLRHSIAEKAENDLKKGKLIRSLPQREPKNSLLLLLQSLPKRNLRYPEKKHLKKERDLKCP